MYVCSAVSYCLKGAPSFFVSPNLAHQPARASYLIVSDMYTNISTSAAAMRSVTRWKTRARHR